MFTVAGCSRDGDFGAEPSRHEFSISMGNQDGFLHVWIQGITFGELDKISKMDDVQVFLQESMPVRVVGTDPSEPPLMGDYVLHDRRIEFKSKFPIQPGTQYEAVYDEISMVFPLRTPEVSDPRAFVAHFYPTANKLPANLLKFYIKFSAPMSRGYGYEFIKLLDDSGEEVADPFPAIGVELWNQDQTQFTLLLDPGRIKRGIGINESMGLPLIPGKSYQLVVDKDWPDANGRPMDGSQSKDFTVVPPDHTTPDVLEWLINKPPANSTKPLFVDFNEPMDYSLADKMVWVETEPGTILEGKIELANDEMRLVFFPDNFKWTPGEYAVGVHSRYEDLAGNQLEKPFEVDVQSRPERTDEVELYRIPFKIP